MDNSAELRQRILALVQAFYEAEHTPTPFIPGESEVPISGRVFDAAELLHLVDASLDFWLTTGRYAEQFEQEFAQIMGVRHAMLCNSGSSANLLALSALTSPKLEERRCSPAMK
jgi:CDP-6-deoxy-D-xylo-4-hexulose-3-dehydrase